jgi:hypothetical protein
VIKIGTAQWTVSRARLQSTSAIFRKELLDSSVKVFENADWEPSAFELFLQWLYTERYQEFDGYAPVFKIDEEYSSLERQTEMTSENMPWCIKAAILAHNLGWVLGARNFMNYAMQRLLQAYKREEPRAFVTPAMVWTHASHFKLKLFLEDYTIQNYGDDAVVDRGDDDWAHLIWQDPPFRTKFMKEMGPDLHVRQEQPLKLEKYLVKED